MNNDGSWLPPDGDEDEEPKIYTDLQAMVPSGERPSEEWLDEENIDFDRPRSPEEAAMWDSRIGGWREIAFMPDFDAPSDEAGRAVDAALKQPSPVPEMEAPGGEAPGEIDPPQVSPDLTDDREICPSGHAPGRVVGAPLVLPRTMPWAVAPNLSDASPSAQWSVFKASRVLPRILSKWEKQEGIAAGVSKPPQQEDTPKSAAPRRSRRHTISAGDAAAIEMEKRKRNAEYQATETRRRRRTWICERSWVNLRGRTPN